MIFACLLSAAQVLLMNRLASVLQQNYCNLKLYASDICRKIVDFDRLLSVWNIM